MIESVFFQPVTILAYYVGSVVLYLVLHTKEFMPIRADKRALGAALALVSGFDVGVWCLLTLFLYLATVHYIAKYTKILEKVKQ